MQYHTVLLIQSHLSMGALFDNMVANKKKYNHFTIFFSSPDKQKIVTTGKTKKSAHAADEKSSTRQPFQKALKPSQI